MDPIKIQPFKVYAHNENLIAIKKTGLALVGLSILGFLVSLTGITNSSPLLFFFLSFGLASIGALVFFLPQVKESPAGVKNNGIFFNSFTARKAGGWILGIVITAFYVLLYWYPAVLENWIKLADPLSRWLRSEKADKWFL